MNLDDADTQAAESTDDADDDRRPRRLWALSAVGIVVVGALIAGVVLLQPPPTGDSRPEEVAVETAAVTRGDLTEQIRVQGTLAYGTAQDIGTTLPGVVTQISPIGTIVPQNSGLFRVDDLPIVLLHGALPAWRTFALGMSDGVDVQQLEQSLASLGLFSREPDEEFTERTASAIEDWQESVGLDETGIIELGRIVFMPGDVRIASWKTAPGGPAGPAVISVSGTTKTVEAPLAPGQQSLTPVGSQVTVSLPDGTQVGGTIAMIGAAVEKDTPNGKQLKVPIIIALDDPNSGAGLDDVTVSVAFVAVRASGVLLVPVPALLAQKNRAFAVEVRHGKKSELVPVELGAFAGGLVEITGGELAEGDTVVVAK